MCLDKITKLYNPPLGERKAWGVFRVGTPLFVSSITLYTPIKHMHIPMDTWIKAEYDDSLYDDDDFLYCHYYRVGFHRFINKNNSRHWLVRKLQDNHHYINSWRIYIPVKIRGIRIRGLEDGYPVYVADEMYVAKTDVLAALAKLKEEGFPVEELLP